MGKDFIFSRMWSFGAARSDVEQKLLDGVYGANISAREPKTLFWATRDKLPNFFNILVLSIVLIWSKTT
jgi:hypothetical protein